MDKINDLINQQQEFVEYFKGRLQAIETPFTLTLTNAGEYTLNLQGNFLYTIDATDSLATVNVQFNRKDSSLPSYALVKSLGFKCPFTRAYFSWSAQAGKTITIIAASFAPTVFDVIDNRSNAASDTLLTAILNQLKGASAPQGFGLVVGSDAAATLAVAANASRNSVHLENPFSNTGNMYLGYDNTVLSTKFLTILTPGKSVDIDDYLGNVYFLNTVNLEKIAYGEV